METEFARYKLECIEEPRSEALTMWLCGQAKSEDGKCWEFQGIFSTREKAIAACRHEWYFIAPVELDAELPDETIEMPGAYYPLSHISDDPREPEAARETAAKYETAKTNLW
jgi:hypothetical protein